MTLFAVFGNPVAHSWSPQIHQSFARQEGRQLVYERQLIPIDSFAEVAQEFFQSGGVGANITVPFKTEAFQLADEVSSRARAAQAVNTLFMRDGILFADNTDGIGLVRAIQELLNFSLHDKRILLLGAGGAAQGVILPLLQQRPAQLIIANRTEAKAEKLAVEFGTAWVPVNEIRPHYDIIINATSGSLQGQMLPIAPAVLAKAELVYDMMYAKGPTLFLKQAQQAGCVNTADGLSMLVAQAAESYYLWHGFQPDISAVVSAIRQQMGQQ